MLNENRNKMIDFDVILQHVGNLGRYQMMLCVMIYHLTASASMHMFAPVFYASTSMFRCYYPQFDSQSVLSTNASKDDILNLTTPFNYKTSEYDTCRRYATRNLSPCDSTTTECININTTETCDDGYVFDEAEFVKTTVTEWELVCDRDYLNTIERSLFFVGAMVGGFVAGYFADRFGRKPVLLSCCLGVMIFGTIASQIPWFPAFAFSRFLVGICVNGQDFVTQVYAMEITGSKHTTASLIGQIGFGIGIILNSFFAYFIRDWRYFYLALSLFPAPYLIYNYFIPESPRWHISKSQETIGKNLAMKFAKHNKKEITDNIWKKAEIPPEEVGDTSCDRYSVVDIVKRWRIRKVTICITICWFASWLTSVGLSLNVETLAGNIFLNNAFNGILSAVCSILLIFAVNRIRRRFLLIGSMILTAVSGFGSFFAIYFGNGISVFSTADRVLTFFAYIGSWIVIVVLFIYTAELYPTVVRSNGMGLSTVVAGLGSITAPIVISSHYAWLPSLTFAILSTIASIVFLQLPETINRPMTETLEEANHFYAGKKTLRRMHAEALKSSQTSENKNIIDSTDFEFEKYELKIVDGSAQS